MKNSLKALAVVAIMLFSGSAMATGMVTCESGDPESWQDQSVLQEMLEEKGWEIRRIKVDGGCYEVYAKDEDGNRVEAYFHPVTLEPVPTEE